MADFCNVCCNEMFPDSMNPDIDIERLFNELEDGEFHSPFLCEGCTIIAIGKFNGKKKAMFLYEKEWVDYSEDDMRKRFNRAVTGDDDES